MLARLGDWRPPLILSAIATALLFLPAQWRAGLIYDRGAVAGGQYWRLLTANFLHLSGWHLLLNVLSLVLLTLLCPQRVAGWKWIARVALIGVGTCSGLYIAAPGVHDYVGLSGMIYGLFLLGLGGQAIEGDAIAIACLVFLLGRVAWELWVGIPASEERLIHGHVVPESHLAGMMAALAYAGGAAIIRLIRSKIAELTR